ncbi:MAG: hypothetical protein V4671_09550, partial [Armatimonadota bacterium]
AGIVYLSGALVWSYNAWINNLGLLPAVQFQYVAAGLPTAAIFLLYIAFILLIAPVDLLAAYLVRRFPYTPESGKVSGVFRNEFSLNLAAILPFFVVARVLAWYIVWSYPDALKFSQLAMSVLSQVLVFYAATSAGRISNNFDGSEKTVSEIIQKRRRDKGRWIGIIFAGIVNLFLFGRMVGFFVTQIYPVIPQEFGGPKPRRAYMDIKWADIAYESRKTLLPKDILPTAVDARKDKLPSSLRTVELDVYFTGADFYLVRKKGDPVESPVIQVNKSTVQGIEWRNGNGNASVNAAAER